MAGHATLGRRVHVGNILYWSAQERFAPRSIMRNVTGEASICSHGSVVSKVYALGNFGCGQSMRAGSPTGKGVISPGGAGPAGLIRR